MTPEDRLTAFFAETAPPARDLVFQAEVAKRVARRRAFATIIALIPWTVAAIVLCWAVGPIMGDAIAELGPTLASTVALLAFTALGIVMLKGLARRLTPA